MRFLLQAPLGRAKAPEQAAGQPGEVLRRAESQQYLPESEDWHFLSQAQEGGPGAFLTSTLHLPPWEGAASLKKLDSWLSAQDIPEVTPEKQATGTPEISTSVPC